MSRAMGWSKSDTLGRLHLFWHWCLDYATDGQLDKHGMNVVADVFEVPELEREKFVQSLRESEFVDFAPSLRVHDWWDYAGKFLQIRYKHRPVIWKNIKRLYGLRLERTKNRQRTDKDGLKNTKPNQPTVTNLDLTNQPKPTNLKTCDSPPANAGRVGTKRKDHSAKSSDVWTAYSTAFHVRYGVDPVQNAKVNSMLCQVVDRLGADEAPKVASYYCEHTSAFYLGAKHCVALLLRDAEGLRMEWATGRRITNTMAIQQDRTSTTGNIIKQLIAEEEGKHVDRRP